MNSKPSRKELELIAEKLSAWAESEDFYDSMNHASARKATSADKEKAHEMASSIKRGRPDIYMGVKGSSPTIQFRVSHKLQQLLAERSAQENKTQSQIAREALAQYLLSS